MTDDDHVTGDAVAIEARPASFVLRAASAVIDVVSTGLLTGLGVWLVLQLAPSDDSAMGRALVTAVIAFCLVVLPAGVETLSRGKSLGRLALGVRIVRDDGGAVGFRHAFVRAMLGLLELYLTLGGGAAIVGLLAPRTKRLGDLVAGTYAMHERVARPRLLAATVPEPLTAWALTADVARLPDPLARRIADFLRNAPGMLPASRAAAAQTLAAEAARYASPVPDAPAEAFLHGISALRRERAATALARQDALLERAVATHPMRRGVPDRG